jgi:ABC-type transport system involved in multi-copper enzyme maturation permease subunit
VLGHLIRKEILDHLLSLRFIILSATGALVIWLSLYDGYAFYRDCLNDHRLGQAAFEQRRQQLKGVDGGVHAPWAELDALGFKVHKPPTPLSIFARGLEPSLGRSVLVAGVEKWLPTRSPAAAEPILGVFPPLDLGLIVQVALSLFVLLFTYDAVCGEKEAGTLRLTASLPVPKHRLLLGKFLGTLVPTLAAFGLPLLLGLAVLLLLPEVSLSGSEWGRVGILFVAFGLYLTVFILAGLFASCLTHRSATSFVILLAFWVGAVAVLPRLSLIAADRVRPAPSIHELQAKKEAIRVSILEERNHLQDQWREAYSKRNGRSHWDTPEGREEDYLHYSQKRREFAVRQKSQQERLDETFHNRYNARLDLAVSLARLSPAFALNNAVLRLAGAGLDRHRRFQAALQVYKDQRGAWAVRTKDRDVLRQSNPAKYGKFKWDISDLPRFVYQDTRPDEDVQAALFDVGILALWGLVCFIGACVAMLRYDLR